MSVNENEGIFREEALYYELGYRFTRGEKDNTLKPFEVNVTGVLFFTSLILQTLLNINQVFTLIGIAIFYLHQRYADSSFRKKDGNQTAVILLILILIANIYDHFHANIKVKPGTIFTENLSLLAWIIEFIWIISFGFQIFVILQPFTRNSTYGKTVVADHPSTLKVYNNLVDRLENSEFELQNLQRLINTQEIRKSYQTLLYIILIILSSLLFLNTLFWRIVGTFGGGNNQLEEYYSAGLALFLFIGLFIFSSILTAKTEQV